MISLFILLIFNSLLCFGFWNACYYNLKKTAKKSWNGDCFLWEYEEVKGVLWFIDKWAQDKWFYKPLCGCITCMASLHSIYPYWTLMYFIDRVNLESLAYYPIYILALSGLNYLIDRE